MNRMYEVGEGRSAWKLRPVMLLVTLALIILVAVTAIGLVVTGPVAKSIGDNGADPWPHLWDIAKWSVLLLVVVVVALLYSDAEREAAEVPVAQRRRGDRSSCLDRIVGGLRLLCGQLLQLRQDLWKPRGVIVFLLWLWLTNVALLFGQDY